MRNPCITHNYRLIFLYVVASLITLNFAATHAEPLNNNKEATEVKDTAFNQRQLEGIEESLKEIKEDRHQATIQAYDRSCRAINRLTNILGITAMILGIIIALAGVFITYESIRTRQRSEKAISTVEGAKSYVEKQLKDIDSLRNVVKEQLSREIANATQTIREREEKGITTKAEEKVVALEEKIQMLEAISLPDDPKLLYSKAMLLKKGKKEKSSIELLQKIVTIDPKHLNAYWQIGIISGILNNPEESIAAFTKVLKLDPGQAGAYGNRSDAQGLLGKHKEALQDVDKAIELRPNDAYYCRLKARILETLEKYDECLEVASKAIVLDPSSPYVYNIRARALLRKGMRNEAIEDYKLSYQIRKEKIGKPDADEGDWLNYFENVILIGKYKEAKSLVSSIASKVKTTRYLHVFDFLRIYLHIIQKEKEAAVERCRHFIMIFEKNAPTIPQSWDFNDILLMFKSTLASEEFILIEAVVKLLLRNITVTEYKSVVQKFQKSNTKRGPIET